MYSRIVTSLVATFALASCGSPKIQIDVDPRIAHLIEVVQCDTGGKFIECTLKNRTALMLEGYRLALTAVCYTKDGVRTKDQRFDDIEPNGKSSSFICVTDGTARIKFTSNRLS